MKCLKLYIKPSALIVNMQDEGHLMAGSLTGEKSESIKVVVDDEDGSTTDEIPTIVGGNPWTNNKYVDD